MSNTEHLILDHLQNIRCDTSELKKDVREIEARLTSIETYIATLNPDQTRTSIALGFALLERAGAEAYDARLRKLVGLAASPMLSDISNLRGQ